MEKVQLKIDCRKLGNNLDEFSYTKEGIDVTIYRI